jgi:hypothetical protein
MSAPTNAERAYRLLMRAYPADFRAQYEREMTLAFRDQLRDSRAIGLRFWAEMVWDVARSAPALRVEALRARWHRNILAEDGTMKPMAMLAMVIGAIQGINALIEARAGTAQPGDYSLLGVVLGFVAAALLVGAGVALLRGGHAGLVWARVSAVACLAMVVLIRVVQPWMSIFGTLLGVGFPIALLLFLQLMRGRGSSTPMAV